jgi:uncharacterized protein DUF5335
MTSRSIPKERWRDELDAFSREHEGWRADVRVSTTTGELRTEVHDLPLVGVSCDAPGQDRIAVLAGDRPDDHLTHEIFNAVAVDIERDGRSERLNIRAADGSETRIEFKPR